jgi:hypothetical protein
VLEAGSSEKIFPEIPQVSIKPVYIDRNELQYLAPCFSGLQAKAKLQLQGHISAAQGFETGATFEIWNIEICRERFS